MLPDLFRFLDADPDCFKVSETERSALAITAMGTIHISPW